MPQATILQTLKSRFGWQTRAPRWEADEAAGTSVHCCMCSVCLSLHRIHSSLQIPSCYFLVTHCLYLGSPPKIESCATQHALPHSVALLVGSTRPSDTAQTQHCRNSSYFRTEISLNATRLSLLSTSMFTVHLVTVANHPNCSTSTSMYSHARPVGLMRNYVPDLCD